eukprot:CAMPEP_0196230286 /NCGR_PEP_ID=MMETSP0913-20130531/1535_1 /TAXON_ID=49265 /ORGANISM="Thalassiosira rotula, Strain GSO102" /LENGTH=97 /DNA_ID=CAMNT_0041510275 /DNA_START=363 /DNA_END=656 /DNA_ORIENTATION=-
MVLFPGFKSRPPPWMKSPQVSGMPGGKVPHGPLLLFPFGGFRASSSASSSSIALTLSSRSISYMYGPNFLTVIPPPSQFCTPETETLHRWSVILSCG